MISLPPHFRYEYCDLWGSLFLGNLSRVAEICHAWGLGAGSEELIGSAVLLRRPGAGGINMRSTALVEKNMKKKRSVMEKKDETPEEAKTRKAEELEAQRAMKAKLKGFLENYDLIPKVRRALFLPLILVPCSNTRPPNFRNSSSSAARCVSSRRITKR
jgi:aarF domain-containing kinase